MASVMRYTMQEKKTLWEGQKLVSGVNCQPQSVYNDFLSTKLLYHKEGGTMFFHCVQSFPAGEEVDPKKAHAAALKLAEWFQGREVLVCTHVDREHIHSHLIVNSVSLEDGKKLHISKSELDSLRNWNDQICMELGLPVFQPQGEKKIKSLSGAEYHTAARGESWKFQLMNTIDECMKYAQSREQFITLMKSEGYDVRWTDSRKNITYTTPSGKKCQDDRLHEEKYLKERMEKEFAYRTEIIYGRTEATQHDESGATTDRERTNTSHTGRVDTAAGSAVWTVQPASGAAPRGETSADPLRNAGADAGADPGSGAAADGDRTGWEREREAFLASKAAPAGASVQSMVAGASADLGGIVGDVVQLGYNMERLQSAAPMTPVHGHGERKQLAKERQKKIAQGHAEDDQEDELNNTYQQRPTM